MWILILTLMTGHQEAPAMTPVFGFTTQAACVMAGNVWQTAVRATAARNNDYAAPIAVCVKQ